MSLRLKFTLALVLSSLAAAALVGGIARWMLLREFGEIELRRSFSMFRADVSAYLTQYGTWEKAQQAIDFPEFSRRRNAPEGGPPPGVRRRGGRGRGIGMQPSQSQGFGPPAGFGPPTGFGPPEGYGPPPDFGPPPGEGGFGPPPGEMGQFLPGGPPPGGRGLGGGPRVRGGRGPRGGGPPEDGPGAPPFRFLLYDLQGKVLVDNEGFVVGQQVPEDLKKRAEPVVVKGETAAWAVPLPTPNLTPHDQSYLNSINNGLALGMLAACVLAIPLGVFFGSRLSGDLRKLTTAIRAMREGRLKQQVPVRSRDEVGVLAESFNEMSAELARANEELHRSANEIREQAALLKELSIRDPLTQLYNRRHFDEQAARMFALAQRQRQPLTLMIGDIDFFKKINDGFSHATGDEVLRRVGKLLRENVRDSDVVARYGGEEFVIAFYGMTLEQAVGVCEKLRQTVETSPWHQVHPDLKVTMSMGVSDAVHLGSFEKTLAAADGHLYRAKETGRNRVCYDQPAGPAVAVEG
jgi:two-component system cell cycle response regulator